MTTFFGGEAFEGSRDPGVWGDRAIAAFVAVAVLSIIVILPWRFVFHHDPDDLVRDYLDDREDPLTRGQVLRDFAVHFEGFRESNGWRMTVMQWSFRLAAAALGVEVYAWLKELAERTG